MSHLLHLPFEIHVQIARNLQLKDCLAYATLSPLCHDAVYYIFSHRIQLDLGSLIANNRLSIQSDLFLQILHAHTRATTIRNFCIPTDFTSFSDLSAYFELYWQHTYIPDYDPSVPEPSMICGTHVGHIRGQLSHIYYLGYYGASTPLQHEQMHAILSVYDDPMYDIYISEEDNRDHILNDKSNWSVVNLTHLIQHVHAVNFTQNLMPILATELFVGSAHTYRRSCHLLTLMMSSSCNVYISLLPLYSKLRSLALALSWIEWHSLDAYINGC